MAKSLLFDFVFDASAKTVKIKGNHHKRRLLMITNTTDNIIIYNFADSTKTGEFSYDATLDETTITLAHDTTSMSDTDALQIFEEEDQVRFEPSETFVDAVSKFRISNPENLIDTDFEYGPQASKWETIQTINNIPSFYASTSDTTIPFITKVAAVAGSELITVTTDFDHGLTSGVPITVTGLAEITAEGTYIIQAVPSATTFTYKARSNQPTTRDLQGTYTSIIPGKFFQGSQISLDQSIGIVSDLYNLPVVVRDTTNLTVTTTVDTNEWIVGSSVSGAGGGAGIIGKIDGSVISVYDTTGTFVNGEQINVIGSSVTYTTDGSSGVAAGGNKYFIDGVQQSTLELSRNSIYTFDLSDPSTGSHPFKFSATTDGTHGGGTEYTTFVYANGSQGTPGAYVRIYIDGSTPSPLGYYCSSHSGMGADFTIATKTTSKVYLTTVSEHGFADNTNFYFVNTVSPKILNIEDPTATAPDGRPFTDIDQNVVQNALVERDKTFVFNYECTYTKRFNEADVDYSENTIRITNHGYYNHYALLYYPNPGNRPLGGLRRMQVYYVEVVDNDTIKLHQSQRLNYGAINLSDAYPAASYPHDGTWTFGAHNFGLVYNIRREYKGYRDWYAYFYTYYWDQGGTRSGYDFQVNNGNYGLGGTGWDRTVFFSTTRPEMGDNSTDYYQINRYYHNRGTRPRTYGYNHETLPFGTDSRFNGNYDFLTDNNNRFINDQGEGNQWDRAYVVQGYGSNLSNTYYYRDNFYTDYVQAQYIRVRGNSYWYWWYQEGWGAYLNRYFAGYGSDGYTNQYIALVKRNTSTNDSFYKTSHGFPNNQQVSLSIADGGEIRYFYDSNMNQSSYTSGTFYINRIDDNRFRIATSAGGSPVRLRYATGNITFSGSITNQTRYSFFIKDNLFSNGELMRVTTTGSVAGGLSAGSSYYVIVVNGNRFQLAATAQDAANGNEIQISSQGSGRQTFENTTADFGTVDGSYTTTRAISEKELEVTIPFKIPPTVKQFDASSNVDAANNVININNHFYSTGTRVIYNSAGGSNIGGLTHNTDYFVVMIDNNNFKLAPTLQDALDGTNLVTGLSTQSGLQEFISANLSGEVTGTGTIEVTSGSRRVVGSNAAFERFFKIGDIIKVVNTTSGTPGVIESRRVTSITDDDNLLVDQAFTFSQSGTNYLIPSFIYVRPDGFFLHRPFDGGMEIGTSKSPNSRISRQTRKYFRYQSGKGIQTSLAINFIPQIPILDINYTASGVQMLDTNAAGTQDATTITVASTTGLVAGQIVLGTGTALNCISSQTRIRSIVNATTVELTDPVVTTFTGGTIEFKQKFTGTATCSKPHQLTNSLQIKVINTDISQFNVEGPVDSIVDDFTFTYLLLEEPSATSGGGFPTLAVLSWTDCDIRCGMFDDQNGFFYEFDGDTLNCVRRSSVQQIPGRVAVTRDSHIVTGTNTMFTSQLSPSDKIVIRGMSYKVVKVTSDTLITVQPSYRGVSNADVIITKTVDTKVPQNQWNIDKADGLGKSAYILDLSKIQMAYMDYSWYGAGKIRFGFKDAHGHVKYFHEFKHNNKLTESYFRSGNLPARYEIENGDIPTYVGTLFHWGTSVIMDGMFQDDEAYLFTASGNSLKFSNSSGTTATTTGNSSITEQYISWRTRQYFIRIPFNSSDANTLTINTNIYQASAAGGYFVSGRQINTRTYTSGGTHFVYIQYQQGTETYFPRNYYSQINGQLGNPAVSNNTDFNVGAPATNVVNLIPLNIPLVSIRLAPSVDSSITGSLGEREIINRMQLALDSVGILTTHETEISLILNPSLSTDTFENVDDPSLCQLVKHASGDTVSGGSVILSFRASGAGSGATSSTTFDLSRISSLGNSILGGDGIYPNGPDLLTVVANIVDSSDVSASTPYQISARITWSESQA